MSEKKRVFSGIQPTGIIHIGNYLGAIKRWIELIKQYECIFSIVDYHAITLMYDPKDFPHRLMEAAKVLVAAGIDTDKAILFVQSTVPEHTELEWILSTITPIGDLERMTQYKDKKQQNSENINAGLLTYPVLMASDILLYKAEVIPVGEDQKQHLELTREIVRRFNKRFGDTFPEPQTLLGVAPRLRGLDGNAKMSKSLNNYIALVEEKEEIWNKLRIAVTDPARKRRTDPGNPEICNIFSLHKYFSSKDEIKKIDKGCRSADIGCIDCKKVLAENMDKAIAPIRERKRELDGKEDGIREILYDGSQKAKSIAVKTMDEIRAKIGVKF